jgi:hypothetical protein
MDAVFTYCYYFAHGTTRLPRPHRFHLMRHWNIAETQIHDSQRFEFRTQGGPSTYFKTQPILFLQLGIPTLFARTSMRKKAPGASTHLHIS